MILYYYDVIYHRCFFSLLLVCHFHIFYIEHIYCCSQDNIHIQWLKVSVSSPSFTFSVPSAVLVCMLAFVGLGHLLGGWALTPTLVLAPGILLFAPCFSVQVLDLTDSPATFRYVLLPTPSQQFQKSSVLTLYSFPSGKGSLQKVFLEMHSPVCC